MAAVAARDLVTPAMVDAFRRARGTRMGRKPARGATASRRITIRLTPGEEMIWREAAGDAPLAEVIREFFMRHARLVAWTRSLMPRRGAETPAMAARGDETPIDTLTTARAPSIALSPPVVGTSQPADARATVGAARAAPGGNGHLSLVAWTREIVSRLK